MSPRPAHRPVGAATFEVACDAVRAALAGDFRLALAAELAGAPTLGHALRRLRDMMRAHRFQAGGTRVDLSGIVPALDARTRADGFHALHDWDGRAGRFNADSIPVEVLTFIIDRRGPQPADAVVPAVLVDYYLTYVLGLLALRAWDTGDPSANVERLNALLAELQGPGGGGQRLVAGAASLLLVATSHYEPDEASYAELLRRVRALDPPQEAAMAVAHAACMGGHLRFGYEATYARDLGLMRDDNVADYPWLLWALAVVMRELDDLLAAGGEDERKGRLVEALLNSLCTDPEAILYHPPASLAPFEADRREFCERFARHRDALLPAFEALRPTDRDYSPLSFFFNFSQNVLKGLVVDALLWSQPWDLGLDDLFTGLPPAAPRNVARVRLATTLMRYAQHRPDTIRGRLTPVIVYDPAAGRRAWRRAMETLGHAGE